MRRLSTLLYRVADALDSDARDDIELLRRYAALGDEQAFRLLVDRHGPLVWGVCRRVLRRPEDAEDAFQATFIALARKAATADSIDMLSAWLHEVARRIAWDVRQSADRRREVNMEPMPESRAPTPPDESDLEAVLDEEVARLPNHLRGPLILCRLQGRTFDEAAGILGVSNSTIFRRLTEATDTLRKRIAGRGLSVASLGIVGVATSVAEALPIGLTARTAAVAVAAGAGKAAPAALVAVADAATRSMSAAGGGKFKIVGLLLLTLVCGIGGAALVAGNQLSAPVAPASVPVAASASSSAEPRFDRLGDPLPEGAVARIGTTRFRAAPLGAFEDVAFLPADGSVGSVHGRPEVSFWATTSGRRIRTIEGPVDASRIEVAPDGRRIAVAGSGEVWVWDIGTAGARLRWKWQAELDQGQRLNSLAYSPNGKWIAVDDPSGLRAVVFDAATGHTVTTLKGRPQWLLFSPDSRILVTVLNREREQSGRFVFWDVATSEPVRTIDIPNHDVVADCAFSPSGRSFVWLSTRRIATTIEVATGREIKSWPTTGRGLTFAPGDETVVVGAEKVQFIDSTTGSNLRPAVVVPGLFISRGGVGLPGGKRLSPDGKYLATTQKGAIAVRSLATGQLVGPSGQIPFGVRAAVFSRDGKTLATFAEGSSEVALWDAATGEPKRVLTSEQNLIDHCFGLSWLADGQILTLQRASTDLRSPLRLVKWDSRTGTRQEAGTLPQEVQVRSLFDWPQNSSVPTVPLNRNAAELPKVVPVPKVPRELPHGPVTVQMSSMVEALAPFAVSPNGERVVVATTMDQLIVTDAIGREIRRLNLRRPVREPADATDAAPVRFEYRDSIHQLILSADGRTVVAVVNTRDTVNTSPMRYERVLSDLWNIETGESRRLSLPEGPLNLTHCSPAISSDGQRVAAATQDNAVIVAGVGPSAPRQRFAVDQSVRSLAFSPDGRFLAAGSSEGEIVVWNLTASRVCRRFSGHNREIAALIFSPGGDRLASASEDGTALVWDTSDLSAR